MVAVVAVAHGDWLPCGRSSPGFRLTRKGFVSQCRRVNQGYLKNTDEARRRRCRKSQNGVILATCGLPISGRTVLPKPALIDDHHMPPLETDRAHSLEARQRAIDALPLNPHPARHLL